MLLQRLQQRLCLHKVGVHLAAVRKGANTLFVGLLVVLDDKIPVMLLGIGIAELDHLAELPHRVDMH